MCALPHTLFIAKHWRCGYRSICFLSTDAQPASQSPAPQAAIAQLSESIQRNQEALATLAKQQAEMTAIRTAEKEACARAAPAWQSGRRGEQGRK